MGEDEKAYFRRLGVFVSSFTIKVAEAVCSLAASAERAASSYEAGLMLHKELGNEVGVSRALKRLAENS